MKRLLILVLISCLSVSVFAKIEMKFEKTIVDFGEAVSDQVMTIEFKFENTGDETLTIGNISTSCGCTLATLEKKVYNPGEKGTLQVKFDPKTINGPVTRAITVNSNDSANPSLHLEIKGIVRLTQFAELEFDPGADEINFGVVKIGQPQTGKIKFKNTGDIPLEFNDITTYPEIYAVFPKKTIAPKEEVEVKIVFTPMQVGRFSNAMRITSNANRLRMMVIRVIAQVN
ncbi:MAG: DUF1573 domain-containing protein [Candidatus Omnitrophota bacterium]